jgi:hypothetical protein
MLNRLPAWAYTTTQPELTLESRNPCAAERPFAPIDFPQIKDGIYTNVPEGIDFNVKT